MQILRSAAVLSVAALVLVFTQARPAHALVFGNFSPEIKGGESTIGVGLSDEQIAAMYDLGIGQGVLGVMAGTLEPETNVTGTEFGVSYKHKLGEVFKAGQFPVKLGVLASFRRGSLETDIPAIPPFIAAQTVKTTLTRIDLGLGASITPVKNLNAFAGVLYERATVSVEGGGDATDSGIGFMGGAEYWVTPAFFAGAEIHSGLEYNDLGLFAGLKF